MNWQIVRKMAIVLLLAAVVAAVFQFGRLYQLQNGQLKTEYNLTGQYGSIVMPPELQSKAGLFNSVRNYVYLGLICLALMFWAESRLQPEHWINGIIKEKV